MVNDVVFHLGNSKTGSTSIQQILANKEWEAGGISLLYTARINHIPLAKTLSVPEIFNLRRPKFTELNDSLIKSDANYAVISAEHFEFCDPAILQETIKFYLPEFADRIRLIAYVRPHADRLMSSFAERMKKGEFFRTIDALHERMQKGGILFYSPRLEKWRDVFSDRFTVRPMIRDQLYKQDVVEDFFNYLFEGAPFRITGDTNANTSLSLEDLALMREMQRRIRAHNPDLTDLQRTLGWNFSPMLTANSAPGVKPWLHKELAKNVVETYRDDAARLDAEFFDGTPMSDALNGAVDKARDAPQSVLAKDHYNDREIQHINAFADLVLRFMETTPNAFRKAMRHGDT